MLFIAKLCHIYTTVLFFLAWAFVSLSSSLLVLSNRLCTLTNLTHTFHQLFNLFLKIFKHTWIFFIFIFLMKSLLALCNVHQPDGWSWTQDAYLPPRLTSPLSWELPLPVSCIHCFLLSLINSLIWWSASWSSSWECAWEVKNFETLHNWNLTYFLCFHISKFPAFNHLCILWISYNLLQFLKLVGPWLTRVFQLTSEENNTRIRYLEITEFGTLNSFLPHLHIAIIVYLSFLPTCVPL